MAGSGAVGRGALAEATATTASATEAGYDGDEGSSKKKITAVRGGSSRTEEATEASLGW